MGFFLCGLAAAISGCQNSDRLKESKSANPTPKAEIFLSPMESEGIQYVAAYNKQLQASVDTLARVKKAMEPYLFDPASAQYSGLKSGRSGAVCGKFNAKNRYGAYVGFKDFVMTGDGRIVASDTSGGIEASSDSYYIQSYLDACGTKAQIASYRNKEDAPAAGEQTGDDSLTQEPDRILDAPPSPRKRPTTPADIPTA